MPPIGHAVSCCCLFVFLFCCLFCCLFVVSIAVSSFVSVVVSSLSMLLSLLMSLFSLIRPLPLIYLLSLFHHFSLSDIFFKSFCHFLANVPLLSLPQRRATARPENRSAPRPRPPHHEVRSTHLHTPPHVSFRGCRWGCHSHSLLSLSDTVNYTVNNTATNIVNNTVNNTTTNAVYPLLTLCIL